MTGFRPRNDLGRRLETIARIAAECRAASVAGERKVSSARNSQQLSIGQLMLVIALWALGVAAWRLTW